jgi:P4 family phage/plasmid primase-like protien
MNLALTETQQKLIAAGLGSADEIPSFPEPVPQEGEPLIRFGVVTVAKGGGSVQKKIDLIDGKAVKDPEHNLSVWDGWLNDVQVDSLQGFADFVAKLKSNQALVLGECGRKGAQRLVKASEYKGTEGTITRTKKHIHQPDELFFLLIEHDAEPGAEPTTPEEIWQRVVVALSEFEGAGRVVTASSSSHIHNAETGECLKGPGNHHNFVLCKGDLERARRIFNDRFWLHDKGFYKLSKPNAQTGVSAVLERHLIDMYVLSFERFVYEAGPLLGEGLESKRPAPKVYPGIVLDLDAIPELTPEEKAIAEANKQVAEGTVRVDQLESTTDFLVREKGIAPEKAVKLAQKAIQDCEKKLLSRDHILFFKDGSQVAAGDLDEEKHLGENLRDPQEPDYDGGRYCAKIIRVKGGKLGISSFAHGESVYTIAPATKPSKKPTQKEQKAEYAKMEAELLGEPADPSDLKYRVRASYRELGELGEGIRLQKSAKGEVFITPEHSAIAEYLRGKYGPKLGKIGNDLYRFNAESGLMEGIEAGDIYELIKNEMDSAWGYEFDFEAKPPSCRRYDISFKEKLSDSWLKGATNATLNALPKIEINPQNPNLIPLLDGILDLQTGTLTPYEVAAANGQFWSYKAQIRYSESFECDRWMDFLAETVHPDDIEPLQAVMCATLMGLTRLKFSVELCGARDSGKSVLQRIMQAFFGGKNSPVIASLDFQKLLKSDEKFSMGAIVGKRLLIIPDTRGLVGSSDRYKQITSGGDLIQAEFKNEKHSQNFTPEGILWSAGNSFLRFADDDDATRSRRIQIRFPHSIPRERQRPLIDFVGDSMLGELVDELPSILNWALAAKEQVNELIGTYKERAANNPVLAFERDPAGQWMFDCLAVGEGFRTNMGIATQNHTLYGNYKEWCADHGISKPLSTIHLKDKLAELLNRYQKIVNVQYVEDKQARKWYWEGVGVLTVNGTPNKDYQKHGYNLIGERLVPEVLEVALDNGTWHEATVIKRDADENIQIRLDTGHYARNPWTGTVKASQTRAA